MKELIIDAKVENLNTVLDFVNAELESVDCPMKLTTQIAIAVEEIFVNIAHYAYLPDETTPSLRATPPRRGIPGM